MTRYNTASKTYQYAVETFNAMAMDQPPADRLGYRDAAMEAIAGPDAGAVLDNLYKNVMARASINFGKIPDSQGELTKFAKYKTIADSITLLERQMGELKIKELKITRELHDNIIRLRDDFTYGFKVDSQFLKTTYNTMVYSLCEMVNLCGVIYVAMLKCQAEGRPYKPEDFSYLLLVQNVEKFNGLVKSGEWAAMVSSIRKDARNLLITVDDDGNDSFLSTMAGIVGTGGGLAMAKKYIDPYVKSIAENEKNPTLREYAKGAGKAIANTWSRPIGKVALIIGTLIIVLAIVRALISLYWKSIYKLDDILNDNEALLKAHMDKNNADPSGTTVGAEKQLALYNQLVGLHDNVRSKILKSDSEGRKALRESNAKDFPKDSFRRPAGDDDFAII